MDLARNTASKLLGSHTSNGTSVSKTDVERALKCVTVIAAHGNWPQELHIGSRVANLIQGAKPLLDEMMRMSHRECFELGLERKAYEMIAKSISDRVETLQVMEEYRRQVNAVIEPLFFAEIVAYVSPTLWHAQHQEKSFPKVRERIPWCKALVNARLSEFQQAAAFEWLLEEVRNQPSFPDHTKKNFYGLTRFAKTGNPEHLPYDFSFVRWPTSLLDWYIRAVEENQVSWTQEEQDQVAGFISLLRERLAAQREDKSPLPPFSPEFRRLHFELLQPDKLDFDTTALVTLTLYRCRCFRENIGKISRPLLEFMSNSAVQFFSSAKRQTLDAIQKLKKTEAAKWTEKMRWKQRIGINPGEGMQRTGLRRFTPSKEGTEENEKETLALNLPEISSELSYDREG